MNSNYTKGRVEPFYDMMVDGRIHYGVGLPGTDKIVALTGYVGAGDDEESIDNALRIAAAWNACDGIETERLVLAKSEGIIRTVRRVVAAEKQRDASISAERAWETAMMNAVGEDGPGSVVEAIDAIKLQRDTAWRELAAIRKAINAHPEESTLDEVRRVVAQRDGLLTALTGLRAAVDCGENRSHERNPAIAVALAESDAIVDRVSSRKAYTGTLHSITINGEPMAGVVESEGGEA